MNPDDTTSTPPQTDPADQPIEIRRRVRARVGARQDETSAAPGETLAERSSASEETTQSEARRRSRRGNGRTTPSDSTKEADAVEVPGAVDEPEVEVEVEADDQTKVRRRRRRRVSDVAAIDDAVEQAAPAPDDVAASEPAGEAEQRRDESDDDVAASEDAVQTPARPRRGRRRGGRGRRGRGRGRSAESAGAEDAATADVGVDEDAATSEPADETADSAEGTEAAVATEPPPTRLSARSRKTSRRARSGGRSARRPIAEVSVETRRAITEGPPKRMLVSAGEKRTQIVVMEERNLVEHYVTRREDVSYVGNIYVGRVQNVLPGMEAAFVDIGKGRNGVLYAGEVNYDEADLEGDLPRIEQTLKPGQTLLVQVTKDPMGTKGARLTQQLSIAGRYCVLAPGNGMLGISRKLPEDERDRLRGILRSIKPDGYGLIVRTAAEGATAEQLEGDVARLTRIWEQVQRRAEQAKPLEAVYEEPALHIRVIRDVFGPDYSDLIVDSDALAEEVRTYLADVSPELIEKVSVYTGEGALFDAYEVTNQIRRALEKKVWLRSGGYLIVEKTEAMWVIDVNTGKFVGKSNLEETVLRNNLEAAEEIARQLRLRDMGGIIVIDFVDMLVPSNRDEVLKRFKRELARDRTKSRVMEISKLGLVQMTRKNVSQGLNDSFTTVCDCCEGRGAVIAESMLG